MGSPQQRLEAFLTWRGWSQREAGRQFHASQTHVSDLLNGKRQPGLSLAHAIERTTGAEHELADGTKASWSGGAIRTEEWDEPAEHVEQASGTDG